MDRPVSLSDLAQLAVSFRDERNWAQFNTPKNMAISLVLEAAELLELAQWTDSESSADRFLARKSEAANELSDVLYWVLLLASDLEIDLASEFVSKLEANKAKYPVDEFFGVSRKYNEG